ncbi:MAG: hypothetical protein ACXWZ8_09375 [Gaiellaceae bacterium]
MFRKLLDNLIAYNGAVVLIAVTAPGADVLPWHVEDCAGRGPHRHYGPDGCRVHPSLAYRWNVTASARYGRLMEAAQRSADRFVRQAGWRGVLPRRVAVCWSEQQRGVWHVHEALPAGSEVERSWTRHVVRFIEAMQKRDRRRSPVEVWALLDLERELREPTRGFYGFGFVDRNPLRGMGAGDRGGDPVRAAAYLARNAARYLGGNVESAREGQELPGRRLRSYVSRRLTMSTGCTIRNLRRARYVYVCIRHSLPLPEWSPAELEAVARLLGLSPEVSRGP